MLDVLSLHPQLFDILYKIITLNEFSLSKLLQINIFKQFLEYGKTFCNNTGKKSSCMENFPN